jgi:hypothetical protein
MTTWSRTASNERNCNLKPAVELRLVWFCYSITRCSFMCQLWSKEHDMLRQRGRQSPHHRAAPFRMLCCLWTLDPVWFLSVRKYTVKRTKSCLYRFYHRTSLDMHGIWVICCRRLSDQLSILHPESPLFQQ